MRATYFHLVQLPSILCPVTSCCKLSPEANRSIELVFCWYSGQAKYPSSAVHRAGPPVGLDANESQRAVTGHQHVGKLELYNVGIIWSRTTYLPLHVRHCTQNLSMDRGIRNAFQRAGAVQLALVIRLFTQGHCWIKNTYSYDRRPSNQREICLRNCQRTGSDRWGDRLGFGYCGDVRR